LDGLIEKYDTMCLPAEKSEIHRESNVSSNIDTKKK